MNEEIESERVVDENIIKEEKKSLRSKIKAKFKEECNLEIVKTVHSLQEDTSYCKHFLRRISAYKDAKTVFGYVSMDVEFPTVQLLKQILKDGKTLVLPRVQGQDLYFCQVQLKSEELFPLQKGAFGIMEPTIDAPILFPQKEGLKEQLEVFSPFLVLVPGRAFSFAGERLGYGGGFYDRFFSSLFSSCDRSSVSLVGLCFSFQVLSSIPLGKYDVLVDEVITEQID